MTNTRPTLAALFLSLYIFVAAQAQSPARPTQGDEAQTPAVQQSTLPAVTVTAGPGHLRSVAIGEVQQTRLQVFSPDGTQLHDSGLRLGNLAEWRPADQQGAPPAGGSYLYLVTVKEFSGRLTQKYGTAVFDEGHVYLGQAALDELPQAQAAALEASRQADTLYAVDRIGVEAMGVATAPGEESGGIKVAGPANTTESNAPPGPGIDIAGTGTLNKVAKWIDNAATLGDSMMFDNGTGVGVGTTDLSDVLVAGNDKFKIVDGPMTFSFRDFSAGQGYFAIGSTNGIKGFVGHTNATDGFTMGTFSNHKLTIRTNSANRLTIDTSGNVGIGTTIPSQRLTVVGNSQFTGGVTISGTLTANLPSGDGSYIQNRTTEQTTSNFNVSGNGTAGGTLQGNVVSAVSEYRLSGVRVLDVSGLSTYVGLNAGGAQNGSNNSFFGFDAGQANTGSNNSFFGKSAGALNQSGSDNSFFGVVAGDANTTGIDNSFFGSDAGGANTQGSQNSFFGSDAGDANTTGDDNSFFGRSAGGSNTDGIRNSFFGSEAGQANVSGDLNSYFGYGAGFSNASGAQNSFFGYNAGRNYTGGSLNSFFGTGAGQAAGTGNGAGSSNSFFGNAAGFLITTGGLNSFVGADAGKNTSSGSWNTFVGAQAGETNTTGIGNTYVGYLATGSEGLVNSGAIGNRAEVVQNNSLTLGSINGFNGAGADTYVGIRTRAPLQPLHVKGLVLAEGYSLKITGDSTQCIVIFATSDDIFTNKQACSFGNDGRSGTASAPASVDTIVLESPAGNNPFLAVPHAGESAARQGAAKEASAPVGLFSTLRRQQEQLKRQQEQIDGLKQLVCKDHPGAEVCK